MRTFLHLALGLLAPFRALVKFRGDVYMKSMLNFAITNEMACTNKRRTSANSPPNHPEFYVVASWLRRFPKKEKPPGNVPRGLFNTWSDRESQKLKLTHPPPPAAPES